MSAGYCGGPFTGVYEGAAQEFFKSVLLLYETSLVLIGVAFDVVNKFDINHCKILL